MGPLGRPTPSQTVGPFFRLGMGWLTTKARRNADRPLVVTGTVSDGGGRPVSDAVIEAWQADDEGRFGPQGFARCATGPDGTYRFTTVKPASVPAADGSPQAPHVDLSVFARGLLQRLVTRIYFPDEAAANDADPVLSSIADPGGRASLVAVATDDGLRFDIRLQGDEKGGEETVFFAL